MGLGKEAGTAEKHVNGLKKTLGGIWRITGGILLFNVIRNITHSVRDLIKTTLDFETQLYNINSVAQLSTGELAKLKDQILDIALDPRVKDGPATLAAGMYEIVSAGYSTSEALTLVKVAAIAATAGMTTTDVAADVLISTLGAYSLGVDQATKVSDQLFQIVNISKYTFEDLANSLATVTPVASVLGVGIDEVGAAMATMAAQGVDAETATVQLNAVMTGFLKPTEAMTKALNDSGYASGEALIQAKGLGGALQWAAEHTNGSAEAAAALFGDVRALRGILQLTKEDGKAYADNMDLMSNAQDGAGATAKALEQQMKANSFQLAVLRKNVQVLAILVFGTFAPILNKVLTGINKFVSGSIQGFRHFRDKGYGILEAMRAGIKKTLLDMFGPGTTKKALKFFDTFVSFFLTAKEIVLGVWVPIKAVLSFMFKYFNILGPAILGAVIGLKLFSIAMGILEVVLAIVNLELAPLTIAMLAFAAIGALVAVAWINNWGDIQGKTKTAIAFIGKWIGKLWDFVKPAVDVIKLLGHYFHDVATNKIQPGNLAKLPGWIRPIALVIARVIKSVRAFIVIWQRAGALAAFRNIKVQINQLGKAIRGFLDQLGLHHFADAVRDTFRDLAKLFDDTVSLIDDIVHGRWREVWQDLLKIGGDLLHLMIDRFRMAFALLVDIFILIPWGKVGSALWSGFKWAIDFLVTTGIPFLLQAGWDLIQYLFNGLVSFWDTTLAPWLAGLVPLLLGYFNTADVFTMFFNVGNFILDGLGQGITFAWNWLTGWFGDLPGRLIDAFVHIYWDFRSIGQDIINGMADGIQEVWGNLTGWIDSIIGQLDRIPAWLRPGSPSKTMTEYGAGAMAGLSLGLDKGLPKVKSSISQVMSALGQPTEIGRGAPRTQGLASVASAAVSGGGGGFGSITVQVTVPGTGDPEAVANRVGDVVVSRILRAMNRMETVGAS